MNLVASGSGATGVERARASKSPTRWWRWATSPAHFVDRETRSRPLPVLTIGGAAGKTTTKTLAAAAVRALFGQTLVTAGNLNNRVGVPMTLFTLTPEHRAIVLECGTSVPGEIAELGRIARPTVAVVVNVDLEHSEKLGSLEAIADEEAALLLAARRVAVANGDDPLLRARLARAGAKQLTFGRSAELRPRRRRAHRRRRRRLDRPAARPRTLVRGAGRIAARDPDHHEPGRRHRGDEHRGGPRRRAGAARPLRIARGALAA